jgi:Autotransporter beta-domain
VAKFVKLGLLVASSILALSTAATARITIDFSGPVYGKIVANEIDAVISSYQDRNALSWGGASPVADIAGKSDSETNYGVWVRSGFESKSESGNPILTSSGLRFGQLSYDSSLTFIQAGYTGKLTEGDNGSLLGSVFGFGLNNNVDYAYLGNISRLKSTGWGGGVDLIWLGSGGFYADALGAASLNDLDAVSFDPNLSSRTSALSLSLATEFGYRFSVADNLTLVPRLRVHYNHVSVSDFSTLNYNATVSDTNQIEGSVGLLVDVALPSSENSKSNLKLGADLTDVFSNGSVFSDGSSTIAFDSADSLATVLTAGLTVTPLADGLTIGVDGNYRVPLNQNGEQAWGIAGKLGWTW